MSVSTSQSNNLVDDVLVSKTEIGEFQYRHTPVPSVMLSTKCNFTLIHHKAVYIELELQSVEQVAVRVRLLHRFQVVHTQMRTCPHS